MFIAHYNTYASGGAFILVTRLNQHLRAMGHDSRIFTRDCAPPATNSEHVKTIEFTRSAFHRVRERLKYSIENRLVGKSPRSYFSTMSQTHKTSLDLTFGVPDIVHLHWVGRWIDLPSFMDSVPVSVPVVWTIHDLSPAAGGCFTYSGCEEFTSGCRNCPLFAWPWSRLLASREAERKRCSIARHQVHVVGNSEFTAGLVRRSGVFTNAASISVIHPGISASDYTMHSPAKARDHFGIRQNSLVLGFCAADLTDENKGIERFVSILTQISKTVPVTGLLIGQSSTRMELPGVELCYAGTLRDPGAQSLAYSAMDAFILCSRMETFGQVATEAQACGTPVWAYDVGGVRDAIGPGGRLVPFDDAASMSAGLTEAYLTGTLAEQRQNCRPWVMEHFDNSRITASYQSLYQSAVDSVRSH